MQEDFVEVYSKTTGAKQMVPPHFVDHPVIGKDFELTEAGRAVMGIAESTPSLSWTREQLDEHAAAQGIDTTGLATKADALAAITGAGDSQSSPETGSTGPGGVPPDAEEDPHNDPANGDEE